MSKSLESLVKKLAETLETNPDPWFNDPCGWLYKPNFKREAQERASVIEYSTHQTKPFSWKRMVTGSPYKKRWFRLDIKRRVLRYYKSQDDADMIGDIDMATIVDVTFSKLYDAPEFAIDLMTIQKHYTVAAESHAMMVKWAYAFKLAMASRPTARRDSISSSNIAKSSSHEKWYRYDFTYEEPGPLYLNVMGVCHRDRVGKVLKNSIVVISFEPDKDGLPGRSEKSGVISVGDYLIGYNGIDLTEFTFNDAVDTIIGAPFPKTLNFLRDTEKVRVANRKEGWAFVYYPALTKHRRRYVEIRDNQIHFHKPAPGGSALSERDAFFDMKYIIRVKPYHDQSMPKDMQFMLRLMCSDQALVEHVNEEDVSIGSTRVQFLDLCFGRETSMNSWRSVLVSPTTSVASVIQVDPLEIVEISDDLANASISVLGLKSNITNRFNPREFRLAEGTLKWKRCLNKRTFGFRKEQSLFLANSAGCDVRTVRALEDLSVPRGQGYRYHLIITTSDVNYDTGISTQSNIVMGIEDERTLLHWLQLIRECVALSPPDMQSLVNISSNIEKVDNASALSFPQGDDEGDVVDVFASNADADDNHDDEHDIIQGYLYKRLERPGTGGSKAEYVKRWFSMKDRFMTYYKSSAESRSQIFALGSINIHQALAVHESTDPNAPDNMFEIVMPTVTHYLVAEDEDDMSHWLEAIGDILEAREQVVAEDITDTESSKTPMESAAKSRIVKLQDAVMFSGELQMKRFNRLTQKMVWRDRFIVIAAGSVYYYEHQDDFYDENKTCTGEIPVVAITQVESVYESKIKNGCGFAIHARVVEGGDSEGFRTYVFEARTPELARQWMDNVCKATGELTMTNKESEPGYVSARINEQSRLNERMRTMMSGSVRSDALLLPGQVDLSETNSSVNPVKRSPLDRRTSLQPGRSGRGFKRTSIIVAQETIQANESAVSLLAPTEEEEESASIKEDPRQPQGSRRGSGFYEGPGMSASGRGKGLGVGALTPKTAMKRESVRRQSDRHTPVPNESV